jgi:hypothetical protein
MLKFFLLLHIPNSPIPITLPSSLPEVSALVTTYIYQQDERALLEYFQNSEPF